jgi:hypothetical protein
LSARGRPCIEPSQPNQKPAGKFPPKAGIFGKPEEIYVKDELKANSISPVFRRPAHLTETEVYQSFIDEVLNR